MARELLFARSYGHNDHPNYPSGASSRYSSLHLTAHVSGPPSPTPARMIPDERSLRVHIVVLRRNMILTPASDGRTVPVPVSDDRPGRLVYDFLLNHHCPRLHELVELIASMLLSDSRNNQLTAQMPTFLSDAVADAWRRGFSLLEINAHVYQTVDVNQTYIFDCPVDQLVDAATAAGDMEVVKGEAGKECPVCLDEFLEGMDVSKLKLCSHVFHSKCIGRWLEQSLKNGRHGFRCPICRSNIIE